MKPASPHPEEETHLPEDGTSEDFGQLVERYQKRLYGLALMMLRDAYAAEEVTQETFIRAFRHLHLYDPARPFYPWLATIAVRLSQTWLRRQAQLNQREGAALEETHAHASTPLHQIISDERARDLWKSVATLPSGERTAVYLFYRQEMKVNDIARTLGVTGGTVKTMLFRARRKLQVLAGSQNKTPHKEKK